MSTNRTDLSFSSRAVGRQSGPNARLRHNLRVGGENEAAGAAVAAAVADE